LAPIGTDVVVVPDASQQSLLLAGVTPQTAGTPPSSAFPGGEECNDVLGRGAFGTVVSVNVASASVAAASSNTASLHSGDDTSSPLLPIAAPVNTARKLIPLAGRRD
jgi:hypothetical protein